MLERRIEIRWRDVDAYGHVNNAVYLTYLEEARDAWVQAVLGAVGDTWHFVLARVAIDFKDELTQDEGAVLVRCRLGSFGRASVRTREEVVKLDGSVSALAESVVVPRDPETGRSRPLTEPERAALERELGSIRDAP
ncbi:MAG TPA: thioesterase family protein [Actinomycetota bacterium]|jgi:acyl-CoA thioester hydrolase|nr:thioesterase family protein [Actinomycetota bacterium]